MERWADLFQNSEATQRRAAHASETSASLAEQHANRSEIKGDLRRAAYERDAARRAQELAYRTLICLDGDPDEGSWR